MQNTLYYGDNLKVLCDYIPDACVDLIYLDPPFNSNRSYNVLFRDESGSSKKSRQKGVDQVIDGLIHFQREADALGRGIVQVMSGRVKLG
jgi:hypothetical protein